MSGRVSGILCDPNISIRVVMLVMSAGFLFRCVERMTAHYWAIWDVGSYCGKRSIRQESCGAKPCISGVCPSHFSL